MKTVKLIMAGLALFFVCSAVNANADPIKTSPTKTDVVNVYIDAISHGDTKNFDNALADDLSYNIKRGDNVSTVDKSQLLSTIKNSGTPVAPVNTSTTVLTDDDNSSVVKIDFKYDDFVRTDVVTLNKTNGWQITRVVTSSK